MYSMKKRCRLALLAVIPVLVLVFGTTAFAAEEAAEYVAPVYATFWALVPPIVAIGLALITKEVYSSLFIGILVGSLLYSGLNFERTVTHMFTDGFISVLFFPMNTMWEF